MVKKGARQAMNGAWRLRLLVALLLCASAAAMPAFAQVVPHVTGTFLTPGAQTPAQANLQQIATAGATPVFGTVEFQPYDNSRNLPIGILCGTTTYVPQRVKAYVRGDGQLVDISGALGVDLIPQENCLPAGTVMRATIRLAASVDFLVQSATWSEDKQLPQTASVDWGSLPVSSRTAAAYVGLFRVQNDDTTLPQYNTISFTGPGVDCSPDAPNARIVCDVEGGGPGGGSQVSINGVDVSDPNFRDNTIIAFSNLGFGNIEATIKNGAISDAMVAAGALSPNKISGTAEVQSNKNALNGYAGLNANGFVPLNRGGTANDLSATGGTGQYLKQSSAGAALSVGTIPENDVVGLVGDLAGKAPTSHAHAAGDIISGVLAYARGGFGAIGTAADQLFITDSSSTGRFVDVPASCGDAVTSKLIYDYTLHKLVCGSDQTGVPGSGITSLNGLNPVSQTFSKSDDTNMQLAITSSGSNHQFALAWLGTLSKARQNSTTVYFDQANTFGAFVQTFLAGPDFVLADPTTNTKTVIFDLSNIAPSTQRTVNFPNANSTTVQAFTGAPNEFLTAISAQGVISHAQPSFSNLSGIAASGQLPASIVYNNQPNTYGAGFKQTFTPSSTTAGINFGSLAGDPSTLANGDCWYNSTAGNFKCREGGTTKTMIGGSVGGGTVNKIPVWTASTTLGDSPFAVATNEFQPVTDAVSDIGDASHRIKDLYISGSIIGVGTAIEGTTQSCTVSAASNGKLCLDSTGNRFRYSYNGGAYSNLILGTDSIDALASSSSAQLATLLNDETGSPSSGLVVFNQSPVIVTPTIASFLNAQHNHQNAAGGGVLDVAAIGTGVLPYARGGFGALGTAADQLFITTSPSAGGFSSIADCSNGISSKLLYATSTHSFSCGSDQNGGSGSGASNYPFTAPVRVEQNGLSLTATITVANTTTPTSLIGPTFSGRNAVLSGSMLPSTFGAKTMKVHAVGTLGTTTGPPTLTITISLGGVTLSAITVPVTASLPNTTGWELDYYFTVDSLTAAQVGGCVKFIGASNAVLAGCASSSSVTGLNFATDQTIDVKATWGTANASNTITINQLTAYTVHQL